MMKGMINMLDNLKLPNKTIDKIYDDGFRQGVTETGKLVGRIPRLINAAFASLDCWIMQRENHIEKTKQLLAENLKNADPKKIVPPEPYVAVPAIQALSYSMDSDELRTLYANLLAKSIYSDTKEFVHPAYTEIIKNLSPLDCRVFNLIMNSEYQEIGCYELRVGTVGKSSYHVIYPYITSITIEPPEKIAASIENLSRNKLISPKDFRYDNDSMYSVIRDTSFFQEITKTFSHNPDNQELRPCEMAIKSTALGKAFYNICSTPL